ncbi:MAG: glucuronate isomerase [Acutalibacteraceae bacterium]|nr:glucuronate isomerase [Acutalibacteraceae bacterium]
MARFLSEDFLLSGNVAKTLYHNYAKYMPIVDYHCHVSPKEIYEDKHFENITEVWLGGDHYKWRIMRSNGVEERYITGDASAREKFQKFAECLPKAIGNPMYHWCHLELKKYFGFTGVLNGETAEEVWRLANEKLKEDNMGVRGLIEMSNVDFIGTTDDPVDTLEWHKALSEDSSMKTTVAPSFRPDKALNIEKDGWLEYIRQLSEVCGFSIDGLCSLKSALASRIEYFRVHGCKASDHGLDNMIYLEADDDEVDAIIKRALGGKSVTADEAKKVKTSLLIFCAEEYSKLGWVMQIHYNCLRNPNSKMFKTLGPDTGFDCIGPDNGSKAVALFLDTLYSRNALPKTILYSLDASDNEFLDTIIGAFQDSGIQGKLQHGSAWWFNDNKEGMRAQLISLANLSLLGNFVGMLTDSRSFLSYTRHEYFRRILCDVIGNWVETGEYPEDYNALGTIVKDICYNNAVRYFGLED